MSEKAPKPLPEPETPADSPQEGQMRVVRYDPISEEERERLRRQAGAQHSMYTRTGWEEYWPGQTPVSKGGRRRRGDLDQEA